MTKEHKHKTNGNAHKAVTGDTEDNTVYAEANGIFHKAETEKVLKAAAKLAVCLVVILVFVVFVILAAKLVVVLIGKLGAKLLSFGATSDTKANAGDIAKKG